MAGKFLRRGAIIDTIKSEQRTNAMQKRRGWALSVSGTSLFSPFCSLSRIREVIFWPVVIVHPFPCLGVALTWEELTLGPLALTA